MEKKNNHVIILVAILIIIILVMGGYLIYDKVIKNNQDNSSKNNEVEDIANVINNSYEEITKEEVETILESDNVRHNTYKLTSLNQLTNQDKLKIAFKELSYSQQINSSITEEELENIFKKTIFGNLPLTHESVLCDIHNVDIWSYSNGVYTEEMHGHGGNTEAYDIKYIIDNFENDNGQYEVSVKYFFVHSLGDGGEVSKQLYGNYNDAVNQTNSIGAIDSATDMVSYDNPQFETYITTNYETLEDKVDEYEYSFIKAGGEIKLVSLIVDK